MSSIDKAVRKSNLRFRLIMAIHLLWLGTVFTLGAWWGRLLLRQAKSIVELETQLGTPLDIAQKHWVHTERMLVWESAFYFGLLVACYLLLLWLYWRDVKRAKGLHAFFASVTHELRTPLTSIRLQAESIAESLDEKGNQRDLVQRLLEDTLRLEAQVERTLELARIEGGGPVYKQQLQIKPWLDRLLKTWATDYPGKVSYEIDVEDLLIDADPSAMQVVVKNILENSLRHSGKEAIAMRVHSTAEGKGVALSFNDNGEGYKGEREILGKLFQKGPSSSGTGVGLYLVSVLMRRMGGTASFGTSSGFEVKLWFPAES